MTSTGLLWSLLGGHGGFNVVELDSGGERLRFWIPVADRKRFVRLVDGHADDGDVRVSAGPFHDRGSLRLAGLRGCVWCRVETPAQAKRLEQFEPVPSLVLHESGSRYVALWGLVRPLWPEQTAKVNRHMAHAFGAPKKVAEQLWLAPGGVVLRAGRKRPTVCTVAGGSGEPYSIGEVCQRLPRRIPDANAWRSKSA